MASPPTDSPGNPGTNSSGDTAGNPPIGSPLASAPQLRAGGPVFSPPSAERGGLSPAVWGIAALIVLVVANIFVLAGHKKATPLPTTLQPPDAYAANLLITNPAMSESANLSGGKMTYLDGHIQNMGNSTVTAATVQVIFANDEAMPPAIQTVPLALVRMTQPYIDTEPVNAEPLKPGGAHDFRLAFESVPENWNQQMPEIRIIRTELK